MSRPRCDDYHAPCPICGRELVRRSNEGAENFRTRQTCGGICGDELRARRVEERMAIGDARRAAEAGHRWPDRMQSDTQVGLHGDAYGPYELKFRAQPGRVNLPATIVLTGER